MGAITAVFVGMAVVGCTGDVVGRIAVAVSCTLVAVGCTGTSVAVGETMFAVEVGDTAVGLAAGVEDGGDDGPVVDIVAV